MKEEARSDRHVGTDRRSTNRFLLIVWVLCGALACVLSLRQFGSALSAGTLIPVDDDSFYHAHRIVEAMPSAAGLMQFDAGIHAPEGSWITWPWAYDWLMARLAHGASAIFGVAEPLRVLALVAPLWVFVNVALFIGIARQLDMPPLPMAAATLCYATSPLTMLMHRFGMLDHHYVEHSFALGSVALGLLWVRNPERSLWPAALGAWLGAAPAFHNGLFILQVPVLATLGARWALGRRDHLGSVIVFAVSLLASTLLFLLPSQPFQRLMYSFSLHSWFHLYIAFSTALLSLALARWPRSAAGLTGLLLLSIALLIPVTSQLAVGSDYLTAHLVDLDEVAEVKGMFGYLRDHQAGFLLSLYGGLLLVLPLGLAALLVQTWERRDDTRLFLTMAAVFGTALMTDQLRLENYGSFALFLLPFLMLARWAPERPANARFRGALTVALVAGSILPTLPRLSESIATGGAIDYHLAEPIYQRLAGACRQHPGIVLAASSDGHPISYFSQCAVLADNFIITRQHEEKLEQVNQLMGLSLAQVLATAPYVRYIFVSRADNVYHSACGLECPQNAGLRRELMAPETPAFPRLQLIGETRMKGPNGNASFVIGRLFEVLPMGAVPAP